MKQRTFEHHHQQQWESLEQEKENAQFPRHYRQVCQHLALARDRHYTPHLIARLHRIVLRGHQRLYKTHSHPISHFIHFIAYRFPQTVRQESRFVGISSVFFLGSFLVMFISVQLNPELIYNLMNSEQVLDLESMYQPNASHVGRNRASDSDFLMFGFYIKHNIGIGFQMFAGGIFFGLGTIFFLVFNGLYLGSVAGHLTHIGYTVPFYSFVAGHSALELIAIILAGAAGLKLGYALIAPKRFTRLEALRQAAEHSVILVYGVLIMLLLAAFVEAFWSSSMAIEPIIKYSVGVILWILVIEYFILVGRHRAI